MSQMPDTGVCIQKFGIETKFWIQNLSYKTRSTNFEIKSAAFLNFRLPGFKWNKKCVGRFRSQISYAQV